MQKEVLVHTLHVSGAATEVNAAGGRLVHVFTEHLLVITLPEEFDVERLQHVSTRIPEAMTRHEHRLAEAWQARFGTQLFGLEEAASAPAIAWDTPGFTPPDPPEAQAALEGIEESTGTPTSLFLTGSVAVGVVMVSGQPWTNITGSLKYVSVGSDATVWGVNANDRIFQRNGTSWTLIPGALNQISVGNAANVWGVNANDEIFQRTGSTWTRVAGALKHVAVGSDGTVWGVNAGNQIFRRSGASWTLVPGSLKQVSVANAGLVWGVNANDEIFRWNGSSWTQVPGALKHVSVGFDGSVFGVNASDAIFRRTPAGDWQNMPGALKQISASSNSLLWGVNAGDAIFTGNASSGLKFTNAEESTVMAEVIEGLAFLASAEPLANVTFVYDWRPVTVSATPGPIPPLGDKYEPFEAPWRNAALQAMGFAASRQGSVDYVNSLIASKGTNWGYVAFFTKYPVGHFAYAGGERLVMAYSNDNWRPDRINQVFAHESGHIFGAADEYGSCTCGGSGQFNIANSNCRNCTSSQADCLMNGNTLQLCNWSRGQLGWSTWDSVSGGLKHVSVGADGTAWGVNANDQIFRRGGGAWIPVPGALKQISVGNSTAVWGVNASNQIFQWNGTGWVLVAGSLKHVAAGNDGTVWGVNASDQIFRRNGGVWTPVPGSLKQISVGNANNVWGVNASNNIFRWNGAGWTSIAGALQYVSVASDGTVWGVNASDGIFRRNGNVWQSVQGALEQVSVGSPAEIWGVNANNDIFKRRVLATP
jgi:hypothetical protein